MGRTQPTATTQPQSFRRTQRAKTARETLNKTIPSILASNARAQRGVESSELISSPSSPPNSNVMTSNMISSQGAIRASLRPTVSLHITDTLTAALALHKSQSGRRPDSKARVAILNMASPLRPGGGFLQGATSQEEFLCMRTTLLPSLRDEFYRLPELAVVFSPDVLVFRDAGGADLRKTERIFVDVLTAGMLRFPDVVQRSDEREDGIERYAKDSDREQVLAKMRAVIRVAAGKKATSLVLGAWGSGAYGNPVREIAESWKKVLLGSRKERKRRANGEQAAARWGSIENIVFAIKDRVVAGGFQTIFGDDMIVVEPHGRDEDDSGSNSSDEGDLFNYGQQIHETEARMSEVEEQIGQVRTEMLRDGLCSILERLRKHLGSLREAQANVIGGRPGVEVNSLCVSCERDGEVHGALEVCEGGEGKH